MIIALMDEARRTRLCEVEDEPEPRFVLTVEGYDYHYVRVQTIAEMPTYYLVDAEIHDGCPSV